MYLEGFGPSQMVCPQYAIQVVLKWCVNGRSKILDQMNTIVMSFLIGFLTNKTHKVGVAGGGRRLPPHFFKNLTNNAIHLVSDLAATI
jgi:hypothetical protein